MSTPIVETSSLVTLVGGGVLGPGDLDMALKRAPLLVAADGGAAQALAAGRVPEAVIGDFDSLDARTRAQIPEGRLFPIQEQDSTDFDKALRSIRAPLVLGVGLLGARIDHQLAAFSVLARQVGPPCVLLGPEEAVFHAPGAMQIDLAPGDVVSLFPMVPVTGRSEGLKWPIDGLSLSPAGRVGTSNRALGPVRLEVDEPGLLVIVPRRALDAAIAGLMG